jgi:hypothetical protein
MKHGMKGTKIYWVWQQMLSRCNRTSHPDYKSYGGRGIKVCKKWHEFIYFYADSILLGYREGLEMDRINNNKGYSFKNVRWTTHHVNSRNRRTNVKYKGECAFDASVRLGGRKTLIMERMESGWSKKRAFTTPVFNRGKKKI